MRRSVDTTHSDRAIVELTDDAHVEDLADLRWNLRHLLMSGVRDIVVDVAGLRQLSSTCVAALLSTHRICRIRGGGVVLRTPNRRTLDLLRRTGLHHVFEIELPSPADGRTEMRDAG